jgi:hypothetical protein
LRGAKKPRAGVDEFTGRRCVCVVSVNVDKDEEKKDNTVCTYYCVNKHVALDSAVTAAVTGNQLGFRVLVL